MTQKHIAVLGSTGGTGIHIVAQALDRGYRVTALAREPDRSHEPPEGLRILQADMHDPVSLNIALSGDYDAVISALGLFPRKPSTELSEGTRNVIAAMQKNGRQRLVLISSFGCGGTDVQAPFLLRMFAFKYLFRHTNADKDRQEALVRQSKLDYTILRPAGLFDADPTRETIVWTGDKPAEVKRFKVARSELARICLDCLEDRSTIGQAMMLSE